MEIDLTGTVMLVIFLFIIQPVRPYNSKNPNKPQGKKVMIKYLIKVGVYAAKTLAFIILVNRTHLGIMTNGTFDGGASLGLFVAVFISSLLYVCATILSLVVCQAFEIFELPSILSDKGKSIWTRAKADKNQLNENFSKEYASHILKIVDLVGDYLDVDVDIKSYGKFYKVNNDKVKDSSWLLWANISDYINRNLVASRDNFASSKVEELMSDKSKIATIAFLINVLEEEHLINFILSDQGTSHRSNLVEELRGINDELKLTIEEASRIKERTRVSSLSLELEQLKNNTFSNIMDMKSKEDE